MKQKKRSTTSVSIKRKTKERLIDHLKNTYRYPPSLCTIVTRIVEEWLGEKEAK